MPTLERVFTGVSRLVTNYGGAGLTRMSRGAFVAGLSAATLKTPANFSIDDCCSCFWHCDGCDGYTCDDCGGDCNCPSEESCWISYNPMCPGSCCDCYCDDGGTIWACCYYVGD